MRRRKSVIALCSVVLLLFVHAAPAAQARPRKPIVMVHEYDADSVMVMTVGGLGTDFFDGFYVPKGYRHVRIEVIDDTFPLVFVRAVHDTDGSAPSDERIETCVTPDDFIEFDTRPYAWVYVFTDSFPVNPRDPSTDQVCGPMPTSGVVRYTFTP